MISDRIEGYLNRINENTKKGLLKWRPITEYFDYHNDNQNLSTYIMMIKGATYEELHEETSFFIKNNDSYLVLVDHEYDSSIDGSRVRTCDLWGVFHKNADVYIIPPYLQGGIEKLQESIIEYWNLKKEIYSIKTSDLFDFLDQFD